MNSKRESLRKVRRILKRTSLEMRRITSVVVESSLDPSSFNTPPFSLENSGCLCDNQEDWEKEPPQTEFSLSDELIAGMEAIVNHRLCLHNTLCKIPPDDKREESRALIFLTLPPTNSSDFDDSEGIKTAFLRFLEEAESYLSKASVLITSDATAKQPAPAPLSIKPIIPDVLSIPGFSQYVALCLKKTSSNTIFNILSNPELRVAASTVKTIIGCACSQITGSDPQHCLNRLNYLLTFFEGSPVRTPGAGAESFRLPQNMGFEFAWHNLIKAALAQAERQFAFSLSSTLPFAAVLATLLGRFPDYIPLFLAHTATACPLLTLYADDENTIFASVEASGGVNEEVLRNWRGISRLFAAVLLARLPPGFKNRPVHLNPKLLWITIAGIARHKNKLEVTAVVLRGLIETGGYVLLKLYKHQARRLFKSLMDATKGSQSTWELGLVSCLELLLDSNTSAENGHGVIFDDFWN
ncbi:unnamed protein product [Rodentolepis nana]|uniref:GLE1 RNA export mediator n=1 Tax=Rodentolepis nana TaxID=102285 RepID=A0A0R3TUU9_RODNA|nr:unnamed protein product [Rodentolepis nana]